MNNLETLALSKATLPKAIREAIKANKGKEVYDVDFTVHVSGTVRVGEDYDQNITAAIRWQELLGLALSKINGVTMEKLMRELEDSDNTVDEDTIKAEAKKAIIAIKGRSKQTCKGKVTSDLTFETESVTAS